GAAPARGSPAPAASWACASAPASGSSPASALACSTRVARVASISASRWALSSPVCLEARSCTASNHERLSPLPFCSPASSGGNNTSPHLAQNRLVLRFAAPHLGQLISIFPFWILDFGFWIWSDEAIQNPKSKIQNPFTPYRVYRSRGAL